MKNKKNVTLINIISSLLLQVVTIISGFIVPRIILTTFGSEVNGLVSSLTQFLNYVGILEGGLTGVVLANLYKPLYKKDYKKISSVLKTTISFYRKLALIFLGYTIILSIVYPLITKTSFSFIYISSLTLILSMTLFIQYNFSLSYRLLLQADKKVYIVSFTQIIFIIVNVLVFLVMSKLFPNIHLIKFASGLIFVLQPLIFNYIVHKNYQIDKDVAEDKKLLNSRWDGFAINVAAFVHNNTDVTILTLFTSLKTVSVYAVHALVSTGLKKLIQSISSAIGPSIGHLYAKDNPEELTKKFELYEFLIFFITFLMFTVGGLLISPFVQIFTKNVTDINYYEPLFAFLLIVSELVYCIREPYVVLAYSANKFQDLKKVSYLEAIINIIISIILVNIFGLIGVAIGTTIAMTYRTLFHVYYLKDNIIKRSPKHFYKKFFVFTLSSLISVLLCIMLLPIKQYNFITFIIYGVIYSIIILVIYLISSIIFYRDDLVKLKKKLIK